MMGYVIDKVINIITDIVYVCVIAINSDLSIKFKYISE